MAYSQHSVQMKQFTKNAVFISCSPAPDQIVVVELDHCSKILHDLGAYA